MNIIKELFELEIRGLKVIDFGKNPLSESARNLVEKELKAFDKSLSLKQDIDDYSLYAFYRIKSVQILSFAIIYNYAGFSLDDYLDKNPSEYKTYLEYVREKGMATPTTKLDYLLQFYMKKAPELIGDKNLDKICMTWSDWISCFPELSSYWKNKKKSTDKELIDFRITDTNFSGQAFIVQMDTGIHVTEVLKTNAIWINFHKMAGSNFVIGNEIYSLRKEAKEGEYQSNYIYVKMVNHEMTAQEAMDECVVEANQTHGLTKFYGQQLKAMNIGLDEYVDGVIAIIEGALWWSATCDRYNSFA